MPSETSSETRPDLAHGDGLAIFTDLYELTMLPGVGRDSRRKFPMGL